MTGISFLVYALMIYARFCRSATGA